MSQDLRVGVAGLIHGHVWGLIDSWQKVEGARLVAVADATPLLDHARKKFDRSYEDWREMLEKEDLDALVVTSDNVESAEIAVQALKKGVPCLVEKAMAAHAKDADRMLDAARESGKLLMINWPLAWSASIYELKKLIDADTVGPVFHMRYRNGHHGPREIGCDPYFVGWLYDEDRSGGGAIADFGCYGAVLARWMFGVPDSVFAYRGNFTKDYDVADDFAVILLKYPKATVVLEASWATRGTDGSGNPVVLGRDGTLAVHGNTIHQSGVRTAEHEAPGLPITSPAEYFLSCLRSGTEPQGILNAEIAADACRILDAAIESTRTCGCVKP